MHKLKENLKQELYELEEKAERNPKAKMSLQELQRANLASDTVKNLCKIEMLEDGEGYSEDGAYMGEGRIYGTSYARGRRNARRDSMGRYSRDSGMSYDDDMSYARDGRSTNRGGMRDNMGGSSYGMSYDGAKEHLMDKAEEMLEMTDDPKERKAIKQFMRELED